MAALSRGSDARLVAAALVCSTSLFDKANVHYEMGEYQEAIDLFRRAYERSREPALLFNMAQAYRLSDLSVELP